MRGWVTGLGREGQGTAAHSDAYSKAACLLLRNGKTAIAPTDEQRTLGMTAQSLKPEL